MDLQYSYYNGPYKSTHTFHNIVFLLQNAIVKQDLLMIVVCSDENPVSADTPNISKRNKVKETQRRRVLPSNININATEYNLGSKKRKSATPRRFVENPSVNKHQTQSFEFDNEQPIIIEESDVQSVGLESEPKPENEQQTEVVDQLKTFTLLLQVSSSCGCEICIF